VHDDLPCMDDDVLRRGKPTCHVAHGEANALLAGDALQTLAFELLAKAPLAHTPIARQIAILADAAGSRGMAGGQALDLSHVGGLQDEAHRALLVFGAGARRLNELADWIAVRRN